MKSFAALIAFVFVGFALPALAGGGSTGGGDNLAPGTGSAWFTVQSRPVRYCAVAGPNFPQSSAQIDRQIESVFKKWDAYMAERLSSPPDSSPYRFASRVQKQNCDGTEDLKFYFGASSPEVEAAKKNFDSPVAFVHRTSFDEKTGWGKGFVWIAPHNPDSWVGPDWTLPGRFEGILLHEAGHIFGCEHMSGTIMTPHISSLLPLEIMTRVNEYLLTHIDGSKALVPPYFGLGIDYSGFIAPTDWMFNQALSDQRAKETFERFTGKKPRGYPKARLFKKGKDFVLVLSDETQSFPFKIDFNLEQGTYFGEGASLFKFVRGTEQRSGEWLGYVAYATITARNGARYHGIMEQNSVTGDGPVALYYLLGGKKMPLFWVGVPRAD